MRRPSIRNMVKAAAEEAECTLAEMLGPSRRQPVAKVRQAAMRRALDAGYSSTEVGRAFNRDHTTVLHAAKRLSRTEPLPMLPFEIRERIMRRDGHRCGYCEGTDWLGIDHVTPRSRGGSDDDDNLVCCCRSCNSSKRNKTPDEWLRA